MFAGGYTIHITGDGSGNYTNVLKAFGGQKKSGYFLLFFRIYDLGEWALQVEVRQPRPTAPRLPVPRQLSLLFTPSILVAKPVSQNICTSGKHRIAHPLAC